MSESPPTSEGKAYTAWKLSFPLLDDKNQVIEHIEGVQDLYVGADEFHRSRHPRDEWLDRTV